MKYISTLICACALCACAVENTTQDLARQVNPFIGTDFTGNSYPGAQVPHGMVQLSPDNGLPGWDRIAGYFYPDSTIAGFSHTHLSGTGAGDLYDISFLPVTKPLNIAASPLGLHSRFSHESENAHAGYYKVHLDDYDIDVELSATPRCGVQRYSFNRDRSEAMVVLNLRKAMNWDRTLEWHVEQIDSITLTGYRFSDGWARNQKVYFCTRFSQPIRSMEQDEVVTMTFDLTDSQGALTVITALSGTGIEGAKRNLQAEAQTDDFSYYLSKAEKAWNEALGKIKVKSNDPDKLATFYTALYHAQIAPTLYDDVDGSYLGPEGAVHRTEGWSNYSTFSLWDTYRAAHPLYCLIQPDKAADMARSILCFAQQNGRLPVWNMFASETDMMIGYHSAVVLAEAALKGLLTPDEQRQALEVCVQTANLDGYREIGLYKQLGYVPADAEFEGENWALSKTLEYAYDDYCIAKLAEHLGEDGIAAEFARRSQNYRNVFNSETGFMQPRLKDGSFVSPFSPDDYTPYICESNAWHYLWSVQHDVDGLIELLGGRVDFEAKLDSLFSYSPAQDDDLPIFSTGMIGQYVHGNEPCHHVAYLYNHIDRNDKACRYIKQIRDEQYANEPAGLCGNEDCGQMSAWYVWSALGLYPLDPVSLNYELGVPMFDEATIELTGGKQLVIKAIGAVNEASKVEEVRWNGRALPDHSISHNELIKGGVLEFIMK